MKQSESVKTILSDLGKAQAEFPTLPKDTNGYNYKYTNLDTVITTLRPILTKYKIGFMQSLTTSEAGKSAITTRLFHETGEWLEDTTPLPDVLLQGQGYDPRGYEGAYPQGMQWRLSFLQIIPAVGRAPAF